MSDDRLTAALTRHLLVALLRKCAKDPALRGAKISALLDASEARARGPSSSRHSFATASSARNSFAGASYESGAAAAARSSRASRSDSDASAAPPTRARLSFGDVSPDADGHGAAACTQFVGLVSEALQLGGKFSVVRILELQQSARRWS